MLLYDDGWTIDKIAKALFIDASSSNSGLEGALKNVAQKRLHRA